MKENEQCAWPMNHPLEQDYHRQEWGKPIYDDRLLFECITLEGAQAGLSWITVLKKRTAYRQAFDEFDINSLAYYADDDRCNEQVEHIILNYDVIKHRGKIRSVFNNAQAALKLIEEYGSLSVPLWQFVGGKVKVNHWQSAQQIPTYTDESVAMSRFLKKNGWGFVGPTVCYAFMQAVGMVNDHLESCTYKYQ